MSGYVHIHRSLIGHPAFRNDAEAMAFAWMVIQAAWKPTRVRYKDRAVTLTRGQLAVSVRDLARAMDRDKGWVERLLKRLKSEAMIETSDKTGVNVVTIRNYDDYQAQKDTGKTAGETPDETDARQVQDTEQGREEEKKEEIPPKPPRKRRGEGKHLLPDDWELPPVADLTPKAKACAEQWTAESYETHGEAFVNYWRARRGMNSDWRLTWCNRIVALHSQVMRDQKFGNAPAAKPDAVVLTPETLEARARWYEQVNKPDDAAEARRQAARLRQSIGPPSDPAVANLLSQATRALQSGAH